MKYLFLIIVALFAFSAHAQQTTCQLVGNQMYCTTFGGGGIRPSIQPNWNLGPQYQSPQQMDQMQAQAEWARQQAELARQQAEQLRQQTEMLRQQQAELERQREALAAERAHPSDGPNSSPPRNCVVGFACPSDEKPVPPKCPWNLPSEEWAACRAKLMAPNK